jgi:hypothetical protein
MAERGNRRASEARLHKLEARRRELHDELRELERAECERAGVAGVQLKNHPASMLPGGVTYITGMSTGANVGGFDVQLKNQPASMLPGGVTYVTGLATSGGGGFANTERLRLLRELSAIRRELAKAAPKPRPLSRAKRDILQALEAMPPEDLDSLQKGVLIGKVQDKVGHARSTIYPILDDFLESRRR